MPDVERVVRLGPSERAALEGLQLLREARDAFRQAGAVRTVDRVTHAISSAKGAVRAGFGRDRRAEGARHG